MPAMVAEKMSKPMTVQDLINALAGFDPELIVVAEGCDCDAEVVAVKPSFHYPDDAVDRKDDCVLLKRYGGE